MNQTKSKPLIFLLYHERSINELIWKRLEKSFGSIDFKGSKISFDITDYYEKEFGQRLIRQVISFKGLMDSSLLSDYKKTAVSIESEYLDQGKRTLNLDVGYLDPDKLVLGSLKWGNSKIYLGGGVYADMLLRYAKGEFSPTKWAFEDFKDGRYDKDLLVIREKLKADY